MTYSSQPALNDLRNQAVNIFKTGVAAADPYQAVKRCLQLEGGQLQIVLDDCNKRRIGNWSHIHLIAFGKAACPMIKAAIDAIPADMVGQAIAVTNYDNVQPVNGIKVIGASHPLPDAAGFNAAKLCADTANNAKAGELVLVLISGGGSALIPYPVESVTLQEKIETTDLLLASGATINQVNCVRKHLSQLKGGGLARLIAPADCHALILSDVIDDDLSAIASGPTVPDDTTFSDAIAVLEQSGIWDKVPSSVRRYLVNNQHNKDQETPKSSDRIFVSCDHTLIGSNLISVNAIIEAGRGIGFEAILYSDKLCGEARTEAEKLVLFAKSRFGEATRKPIAILAGGETTVTIKGNGRGGRNQEMALAVAIYAKQHEFPGNWVFLSGGTDGRDGPTDAAGGLVDSGTIQRMIESGINPVEWLANNDSYTALQLSHDLLMTGATGTNVADLQVLLIEP
ncbi:glycerate 2-kinase [biofilm metagenome]